MFQRCQNENDIIKLFKRLALRLHPDCGGDHDLMVLLIEHKDQAIQIHQQVFTAFEPKSNNLYEKTEEDVHSDDERLKIIADIKEYAKTHPKFSLNFTNSIEEFLSEKGYITSSQFNVLVKTYHSFRMYEK